jgi:alpha-L-fucosidase
MKAIFYLLFIIPFSVLAQKYQPAWESLDSRETPQWFTDAKFGIFIHWGVYSVPAYRPFEKNDEGDIVMSGTYAEWYAPDVMYKPARNDSFHYRIYGKDFEYFDFADMFTAELYDPQYWAQLFKESGAKYVILTSKHCEGFAMWPSKEEYSKDWNVGDVGPKRDLLGDLTTEVRKQGLKMGYYYSFLEYWTTKTNSWPANPAERTGYYVPYDVWKKYHIPEGKYVDRIHFHIKELVNNYQPDIIWPDAEWDHDADYWKSKELLAWIYNNAPNKDSIAVNDRWAKGTRGNHGGYYTTEYGHGSENVKKDHPWEECRGMGYSFGYNRAENIHHYKDSKQLIHTLIRIVSKGGNLLLNVGPTADGRIPVIMQERLIDIGKWLEMNGEAIYGTRPLNIKSEPEKIHPEAGETILFTQKEDALYAICLEWPEDDLVFHHIPIDNRTKVRFLGNDESDIEVKKGRDAVKINLSCLSPANQQAAYVFKMSPFKPGSVR